MADDLFSVEDKIVVITGGLGLLGRQFSRALTERGACVAIFDLSADGGQLNDELRTAKSAGRLLLLEADVTDRASLESALAEVNRNWGTPEGLINSAALDSPPDAPADENGPFETYPEASWDKVMDVNVKGVFLTCQVVGSQMTTAGRGSIISISSTYGLVSPDQRLYEYRRAQGQPFFKPVAYSASKSALFNLTRHLATYWASRNVRVNTLTFGGVFNNQDERFREAYCGRVPLGRMADETEYNGAVIFLVSDASSYMTGANLVIDGGWTAW